MLSARETFRQHEILLIGANGFLGKVILALLLDRFPDFRHLHVLVRPKRRLSPRERFDQEVLGSPPLAAVVERFGVEEARRKITILRGDLGQFHCGLDDATIASLSGRVGLVLNCAGMVDFLPPVDQSFQSNVDGVEHAISLTRALGAKLLHVSTCFVCGESEGFVEESEPILGFYPRRKGPKDHGFRHDREIRYMRERIREAKATAGASGGARRSRELARRLSDLGAQRAAQWGWTNTYTYTKSLGEQVLAAQSDIEYTIVRPAIVEAALSFPFRGWVEGGRTAAPLVVMAVNGLSNWAVREDAPMEVVPVDLVASSILICALLLLNGRAAQVYHVSTADVNPIYFGHLVRFLHKEYRRNWSRRGSEFRLLPRKSLFGRVRILTPEESARRGRRQQQRLSQLQQLATLVRRSLQATRLPGEQSLRNLAATLRLAGLRAAMRDQALDLYRPFMYDNRFIFEAENMRRAYSQLTEQDRVLLPWHPEQIDWEDYWINSEVAGVERWIRDASRG